MARRAETLDFQWLVRGRDFEVSSPEARARNGVYRGTAKVRRLPPGVCGRDLDRARALRIAAGQVWLRGPQRVRVTRVASHFIWFRELTLGTALRRQPRWLFMSESVPAEALGADDGRDE